MNHPYPINPMSPMSPTSVANRLLHIRPWLLRFAKLLPAALACVFLSGCLQLENIITVKSDGSGTYAMTVLMPTAAMKGLGGIFGESSESQDEKAELMQIPSSESLSAQAKKLGEGVTFQSVTPLKTEAGKGYKVVFAFTDISKLNIQPDGLQMTGEDSSQPFAPGVDPESETKPDPDSAVSIESAEKAKADKPSQPITFGYTRDAKKGARLTIRIPSDNSPDTAKSVTPEESPVPDEASSPEAKKMEEAMQEAMMGMMTEMFKQMRLSMRIVVEGGKITQTNATFREGNEVTVMEMNFSALTDSKKWKQLMDASEGANLDASRTILKGLPGMKIEEKNEIFVDIQ